MLTEKEKTFDWTIPFTGRSGRNIDEDFRVAVKYSTLYLGQDFLNRHFRGIDLSEIRVAFIGLNNDDQAYMVINPNAGVPHFKFKSNPKSKRQAPSLSNKYLCELIKNKFQSKDDRTLSFKLEMFQRFNGMMFYSLILE